MNRPLPRRQLPARRQAGGKLAPLALIALALSGCRSHPDHESSTATGGSRSGGPDKAAPIYTASAPRSPKPAHPAAPLSPAQLPALSAHKAAVQVSAPASADYPCGQVEVNGDLIPLDCLQPEHWTIPDAAQAVLSHAQMAGAKQPAVSGLPAVVDHRLKGTEGPMRNQGAVPACTGFSLAAAIDHSLAHAVGKAGPGVSVLELWSRYHQFQMGPATDANRGHPLTSETIWPYDQNEARLFIKCPKGTSPEAGNCGDAQAKEQAAAAEKSPYGELTALQHLNSADHHAVRAALAAGQDVWFCAKIGGYLGCGKKSCNLEHVSGSDDMYIRDFDARKDPGGHCMVLSGYQTTQQGTYYLIHNSWGTGWANKGYGLIHEDTFHRNVEAGATYLVTAMPAKHARQAAGEGASEGEGDGAEPELARARAVRKLLEGGPNGPCREGHAPDSITEKCEPLCPDESPRGDGYCADAAGCPEGQTNLLGECVPAAPRSHAENAAGVASTCGPGGCSYKVPGGQIGCPEGRTCAVSCPAPRYRLGAGPQGVSCMP
jgi:Papain family cysteine protease